MYYQYVEDQQDLIDVVHDSQGNLENDVPWIYENKCFDFETKEITISNLPKADVINENIYFYWDDEKETYILLNDKGAKINAKGFEKTYAPQIINEKLWSFEEKAQVFDISSVNLYEIINNKYINKGSKILSYINGKYIIQYSDKDDFIFEEVKESDLI